VRGYWVRVCLHFPINDRLDRPCPNCPAQPVDGRPLPITYHAHMFPNPIGKSLGLPRHFSNSRPSSNYIPIPIGVCRTPVFYTHPHGGTPLWPLAPSDLLSLGALRNDHCGRVSRHLGSPHLPSILLSKWPLSQCHPTAPSQNSFCDWVAIQTQCLHELFGMGGQMGWARASATPCAPYLCWPRLRWKPGVVCTSCILSSHQFLPFYRIQEWTKKRGAPKYFSKSFPL